MSTRKIMALGKNQRGEPLFVPADEEALAQSLVKRLASNAGDLARYTGASEKSLQFRAEVKRKLIDPGDPRQVGWAFVVAAGDPDRDRIVEIVKPLADLRGMADPSAPLVFPGGDEDTWMEWVNTHFFGRRVHGKDVPHYVLLVGGPDKLPFRFQSFLGSVASVGRLDFDDLAHLEGYVKKILRLEQAPEPVVDRRVVLFGTDEGLDDPTHFSRKYMVEPLAKHIERQHGFETEVIVAQDATKKNLVSALRDSRPALVYTASHGLGLTGEPMARQRRWNGAICCQGKGLFSYDDMFGVEDVPPDEVPFLEGSVFFQFACFGLGTPANSFYSHWLDGVAATYAEADFVAALPKRLLRHPRGPVACIGHLDLAFLHGFTDPNDPDIDDRWHERMSPFVHAVNGLLQVLPSGLSMEEMAQRYNLTSAFLARQYEKQKLGKSPNMTLLVDNWIFRNDAQNYLVLGDPAAHLRIAAPEGSPSGSGRGGLPGAQPQR